MQPSRRQKNIKNESATEIDIRAILPAFEWFMSRFTPFLKFGGTVRAREKDFSLRLEPFREMDDIIPGLKDVLNVFEHAPAAGDKNASPNDRVAFVVAIQSVRAVELDDDELLSELTGRLVAQAEKLVELFGAERADWFPELLGNDLPTVPMREGEVYGGREAVSV